MTTPQTILLDHFGSQAEIARAAGVTRQAVLNWFTRGAISYAAASILSAKMGIKIAKLQVRWVPKTGRHLNERDAKKLMKRVSEAKRKTALKGKR